MHKKSEKRFLITAELTETVPLDQQTWRPRNVRLRNPDGSRKHYAFRVVTADAESVAHGLAAKLAAQHSGKRFCEPSWTVEPYKSRKLKAHIGKSDATKDDVQKRMAIAYARWIAAREGIALPKRAETRIIRQGVYTAGTGRYEGREIYEPRARAVEFGRTHSAARYDGRHFRGYENEWTGEIAILIPHWDWMPAEPVEETIPDDAPEFFLEAAE